MGSKLAFTRPVKAVVPGVVTEDLNTARTQLQNAGFVVGSPIQVTSAKKAGTVIAQDPQARHTPVKNSPTMIAA